MLTTSIYDSFFINKGKIRGIETGSKKDNVVTTFADKTRPTFFQQLICQSSSFRKKYCYKRNYEKP